MLEVAALLALNNPLPPPGFPDPLSLTDDYQGDDRITFIKLSAALGTLVLLIYDYLCTFDQEVEYVWLRPRSLGTYLFVLNRYLPFVSTILKCLGFKIYLSAAACQRLNSVITWLNLSSICLAQAILYLRTIALWARNRYVLWSLAVLYICAVTPCIVLSKIHTDSLRFIHPPGLVGCMVLTVNPISVFDYLLLMLSETVIVVLTLIRAYSRLQFSNSWWVHQLYARGILFYVYLLAFTILNVIFFFFAPTPLKSTFSITQVVLHSVFCNRVIFVILSQQPPRNDTDFNARPRPTEGVIMSTILDAYATRDELYPPHPLGETRHRGNPP